MESRELDGLELAHIGLVKRNPYRDAWRVSSHTEEGVYEVRMVGQESCTCPDFELRGQPCKHIYATHFAIRQQEGMALPSFSVNRVMKPTYPQKWNAYNNAQVNEKHHLIGLLKELCSEIPDLESISRLGRRRVPMSDILFAMVLKTYGTLSGRRSSCDLKDCEDQELVQHGAHYNTIFNYAQRPEVSEALKAMIERTSRPFVEIEKCFAIDSTGFGTTMYAHWFKQKYGGAKKRSKLKDWKKLRIVCGTKTNIITSFKITDPTVSDMATFEPLVADTAGRFHMEELSADKGYLSDENYQTGVKYADSTFIAFKINNRMENAIKRSDTWQKMLGHFLLNRKDFLDHYHKRSNVEATMHMMKSKFGPRLRAKNQVAQENELMCKVLCHNICVLIQSVYELGLDLEFWGEKRKAA